jgi:trans-aconitate methyltransferase
MTSKQSIHNYWNEFYSTSTNNPPPFPSQFAAFVAGEIPNRSAIIEFGCGSGRDTEFFAFLGHTILGLDGSESAISKCTRFSNTSAEYQTADLSESKPILERFISRHSVIIVYARFFLHAITEEEQDSFITLLSDSLQINSLLAFEYRTREDIGNEKSFGNHFRRYIDHTALQLKLADSGFKIQYQIKGKGLAKYKSEDAEVGRIVCTKSR